MTELVQRKGEMSVVMGFLVVVFALAAWRGMDKAPVIAIICGVLAAGTAVLGVLLARGEPTVMRITPFEITWGTKDAVKTQIVRDPASRLRFRRNARIGSPWVLIAVNGAGLVQLQGFHPQAVGKACTDHGWEFETPQPFTW